MAFPYEHLQIFKTDIFLKLFIFLPLLFYNAEIFFNYFFNYYYSKWLNRDSHCSYSRVNLFVVLVFH